MILSDKNMNCSTKEAALRKKPHKGYAKENFKENLEGNKNNSKKVLNVWNCLLRRRKDQKVRK